MPYVEAITVAGKTIEIERYYTSRYKKKGIKRGDKVKPTKEEQKKVNTRVAEKKLRRLMNANFVYGDYHIVLDYKRAKDEPHRTKEEMTEDKNIFLRALRKECKKIGITLKYIHVMEIGEKGARHHHLVINQISTKILQNCWEYGRVKVFPLDETGQYKNIASYFIKYTDKTIGTEDQIQGKRWNSSKNLIRPEPHIEIISDKGWYRAEPKAIKGYYIDKDTVEKGIHSPDFYGYGYFRYTMVKLE